jgi:hypothetical protein
VSVFALLLTLPGLGLAAVSASLDRNTIDTGDTTTLRITTSGDDADEQPDLTPLQKDFKVLGTRSSTQIQIFNGQRSDKHEWLIELMPVTKGALTVPALSVGKSRTDALTLQVREQPAAATAQAGQPVFIRSEIAPARGDVYVQQQLLYTTRLYYRVPLIEGAFSAPKLDNAVVEQLGEDKQYSTTIDGQSYQVLERRYAVFPERSGRLSIAPVVFNGRTVSATGQRSAFGGMDSAMEQMLRQSGFSERFFGGTPFGDPGKPVRLASNTLTLDIQPRPAGYSGTHWLPTEKLVLQDSWANAPPVMHAGEPITRTLTLDAKGLEASQLPDISLTGSDTLQVYPEQPKQTNRTDGDWVYGRSEQRFTYVASQPGTVSFPAVQVSWWDSLHHKQQSAVLPAREVTVAAGGKSSAPASPASVSTAPALAAAASNTATTAGIPPSANERSGADHRLYWLLGAGVSVLLLVMSVLLYLSRQRKPLAIGPQDAKPGVRVAPPVIRANDNAAMTHRHESLRDACNKSDARAAAAALLDWAAATWPDQPPRSLGALAARVAHGAEAIRELEAALYGANPQRWIGAPLWRACEEGLLRPAKAATAPSHAEDAPPLYPDWRKQAG